MFYALLEFMSDILHRLGLGLNIVVWVCMLVLFLMSSIIVLLIVPEVVKQLSLVKSQLEQFEVVIESVFTTAQT